MIQGQRPLLPTQIKRIPRTSFGERSVEEQATKDYSKKPQKKKRAQDTRNILNSTKTKDTFVLSRAAPAEDSRRKSDADIKKKKQSQNKDTYHELNEKKSGRKTVKGKSNTQVIATDTQKKRVSAVGDTSKKKNRKASSKNIQITKPQANKYSTLKKTDG